MALITRFSHGVSSIERRTFADVYRETALSGVPPPASDDVLALYAHPATVAYLLEEHKCAKCNALYKERDNIGTWRCRTHYLPYDFGQRRWPCCGIVSIHSAGCMRADHTTEYDEWPRQVISVPRFLLSQLTTAPLAEAHYQTAWRIPYTLQSLVREQDYQHAESYYKYLPIVSALYMRSDFKATYERVQNIKTL